MIGKVNPEALNEHVFTRTGATDDAVRMGPRYGEDAAAITFDGTTLVVSSDPISLAAERIGTLGIHVACNDIAASGADPRWLTTVVFLPDDDPALIASITEQLDREASRLGVAIVGGHSEYVPDRTRPLLSLTSLGVTTRFIPTSGANPGDRVILTKGAGIEGTAIIASDFRDRLTAVGSDTVDRAAEFFDDISVVPDAAAIRDYATAMHDPTEGGVIDGLLEVAHASNVSLLINKDEIPLRPETTELCTAIGVDPLRIFGSGALIATVGPNDQERALESLSAHGIRAAVIGTVEATDDPAITLDGATYHEPVRDDLYDLWT